MMSEWLMLFKGFCTGFFYTFISISGMVLVAHYCLQENVKRGFIAALGIICVQAVWAILGLLILTGSFKGIQGNSRSFTVIGSLILFLMAVKIYRKQHHNCEQSPLKSHPLAVFGAGLLIALAIPIRILGYAALFTVLGIHKHLPTLEESSLPIIGVILGTLCWWTFFLFTLHRNQKMISSQLLQQCQRYAAFILIAFSVIGLLQLYF